MNIKQSRASFCMALGMLAMGNSGHVSAQEDTSFTSVPHTFESGDVISAEQMNNNFAAIVDAIAEIKAASGTQDETVQTGFVIKDAGTFAGSIGTVESGGNFSLLPGADGATGITAADAACEANYPDSHAEMDALALWKSAGAVELPVGKYWTIPKSDIPLGENGTEHESGGGVITSGCDDWTKDSVTENGNGKLGPTGNFIKVSYDSDYKQGIYIDFDAELCLSSANPYANEFTGENNPLIACYMN